MFFTLLQTPAVATAAAALPETHASQLNIFDLVVKGGVIMIPIAILSILSIYIFVERLLFIKKQISSDTTFMNTIEGFIRNGNIESAQTFCKSSQKPVARMMEKGISRIGMPIKEIEDSIEIAGKFEVYKLEKNTNILRLVSGIAPMLGFLGTLLGVIQLFYDLSTSASGLNMQVVSNGMYVKLVTSVAGLVVGICAFIFYNWINALINKAVQEMEWNTMIFLDLLKEPTK
jgi:biopolymer transport protein ExbB